MPRLRVLAAPLLVLLFALQSCTAPSEAEKAEAVASITVSQTSVTVSGAVPQRVVTATVVGTSGRLLTDRLVTWRSSNTAFAQVSSSGYQASIVYNGAGKTLPATVTVTVTCEGKTARVTVSVV